MERYISTDKSKILNIASRKGVTGQVKKLIFLNSDGTGHDITSYDFVYRFYKSSNSLVSDYLFELSVGSGLTISGADDNELNIALSASQASRRADTYFCLLLSDDEDEPWLNGDWTVHTGKFDGYEEEEEIAIYTSGNDVYITVGADSISQNTRVQSTASTATLTPNVDDYDMAEITAQAAALTIAAPTGTPSNGNAFVFRITDNGTARAITFNGIYRAIGSALPTTTVINKTMYFVAVYNSGDIKWDVLPYNNEV